MFFALVGLGAVSAGDVFAGGSLYVTAVMSQDPWSETMDGTVQNRLKLISVSSLATEGRIIGGVAVYDDPTTSRPADYVEVFASDGTVVLCSWYDRFGIARLIVDRALIDGAEELEGEFVTLVRGDLS
jgi:hypothetical protein